MFGSNCYSVLIRFACLDRNVAYNDYSVEDPVPPEDEQAIIDSFALLELTTQEPNAPIPSLPSSRRRFPRVVGLGATIWG